MKANIVKILFGIALIALGSLALADTFGVVDIDLLALPGWAIVSACLSAVFFLCYFLVGVRNWGWLFPALLFAALALIVGVFINNQSTALLAVPILMSIGIPFYVGYLLDREHWGLLIPAWVMTVIPAIVILAEAANPDLIGATVLLSIALPFLLVFLLNRTRRWALIVCLVLVFIGLFPLTASIIPDAITGPMVMAIFTFFFLALYFALKKAWWAIIPTGVFANIGVVALLDSLLPNNTYFTIGMLEFGVYTGVLLLGFATTFGILWLLRGSQPTAWAKYPALVLLILSALSLLLWKTSSNLVLAVAMLVIGGVMIVGSFLKRRSPSPLASKHP